MPEFRVIWEIDIDAETPRAAAEEALKIQRDRQSTATVFKVSKWSGRRLSKLIKYDTFTNEIEIDLGWEQS